MLPRQEESEPLASATGRVACTFSGGSSFVAFEGAGFRLSDPRIIRHFKIYDVRLFAPHSELCVKLLFART